LIKDFEKRVPRTEELPCNPVQDYHMVMGSQKLDSKLQSLEDGISDDGSDLSAAVAVDAHFGAFG
jgi:hypothetical protein